jgi:hypothetical protein
MIRYIQNKRVLWNLLEVLMQKGTKIALVLGSIPFVTLVFALPLVNRTKPIILGLPFLLFWILTWVILTPLFLFLAYLAQKKYDLPDEGEEE